MFEGGPETMLKSLDILCQLADDTLLWPGLLLFIMLQHSGFDAPPKIFLVLLEILDFIISCNLTFTHLFNFTTVIVLKPIVNTYFFAILIAWHCMAMLMCH